MKVGDLVRHTETDGLFGVVIMIEQPHWTENFIYFIRWSKPTPWTNSYEEWTHPDVLEIVGSFL